MVLFYMPPGNHGNGICVNDLLKFREILFLAEPNAFKFSAFTPESLFNLTFVGPELFFYDVLFIPGDGADLSCRFDYLRGLRLELFNFLLMEQVVFDQLLRVGSIRIQFSPLFLLLHAAVTKITSGYWAGMVREAVALCFYQYRQLCLVGGLYCFLQCTHHRNGIHPVDNSADAIVSTTFLCQIFHTCSLFNGGAHTVLVVFNKIDNGKLPYPGKIQGLMENPLLNRSVSQETNDHIILLIIFRGKSSTCGQGDPAGNNRITSHKSNLLISKVH